MPTKVFKQTETIELEAQTNSAFPDEGSREEQKLLDWVNGSDRQHFLMRTEQALKIKKKITDYISKEQGDAPRVFAMKEAFKREILADSDTWWVADAGLEPYEFKDRFGKTHLLNLKIRTTLQDVPLPTDSEIFRALNVDTTDRETLDILGRTANVIARSGGGRIYTPLEFAEHLHAIDNNVKKPEFVAFLTQKRDQIETADFPTELQRATLKSIASALDAKLKEFNLITADPIETRFGELSKSSIDNDISLALTLKDLANESYFYFRQKAEQMSIFELFKEIPSKIIEKLKGSEGSVADEQGVV